ncbi:MAG: hypothetical protein O2917_10130 [Acidobacteria bacterium]|nr:hypothetical protein [Acidobacteriota bacterium]
MPDVRSLEPKGRPVIVEEGRLGASLAVLLDVAEPERRRESVDGDGGRLTRDGSRDELLEDVESPPPPPDEVPPPDDPEDDEPPLVRGMAV